MSAFDGDFDALTAAVKVTYGLETAIPGRGVQAGQGTAAICLASWQLTASHQSYLAPQRKGPGNHSGQVHLFTAKADLLMTQRLYLTGQAAGV